MPTTKKEGHTERTGRSGGRADLRHASRRPGKVGSGTLGEFEAYETAEANLPTLWITCQPLLLTDAQGGKSWREHGVKKSQIYARNSRVHEGSEKSGNI